MTLHCSYDGCGTTVERDDGALERPADWWDINGRLFCYRHQICISDGGGQAGRLWTEWQPLAGGRGDEQE